MTPNEDPGWRRLTPAEIEALRQEMRQDGQWAKAELAKRRREHAEPPAGSSLARSGTFVGPRNND
ncbi:uncharacterized protein HELO_3299B [Halomonas elongata DSM 2581]|uniref:Uncharacterized protein n=1 Tax=Halomonas elongata (strain ATCC 33173 / DSM 2581 / NBRC 15536 / NCIMB 2198 / 1H9) TaxID=768066 RepID=A0A1R4A4G0_HALED|nr:uncharacterized protein HELO_3299B [Halomonas elongata DSM 2581]